MLGRRFLRHRGFLHNRLQTLHWFLLLRFIGTRRLVMRELIAVFIELIDLILYGHGWGATNDNTTATHARTTEYDGKTETKNRTNRDLTCATIKNLCQKHVEERAYIMV